MHYFRLIKCCKIFYNIEYISTCFLKTSKNLTTEGIKDRLLINTLYFHTDFVQSTFLSRYIITYNVLLICHSNFSLNSNFKICVSHLNEFLSHIYSRSFDKFKL